MAKSDNTIYWILGGLGLAALAFAKRGTIMLYGEQALQAGKEFYFKQSISDEAQPYADLILQVAREQGVDPFILYALGQRESRWGEAIGGPAGTGDNGHGRGIMQIDDRSFGTWLASNDWTDPYTNVTKGAQILKAKMTFLSTTVPVKGLTDGVYVTLGSTAASRRGVQPGTYPDPRPLTGEDLTKAAVAAYNTGEGNVLMSLAAGVDVDTTTAGGRAGKYLADVWNKMNEAAASFQSLIA